VSYTSIPMKLFESRESVIAACQEVRRTKDPALAAKLVSASIDHEFDDELDRIVSHALHEVVCGNEA